MVKNEKSELILENLGCANCASKMDKKINDLNGVKNSSIDFISKKLKLELEEGYKLEDVFQEIKNIVTDIEPGVKIVSNEDKKSENNEDIKNKKELVFILIGIIIYLTAIISKFPIQIKFSLYLVSYLILGGEVLLYAFKNILKGRVFDENFLMSIATIGALAIGQYGEAVAVMLFYRIGEFFQELALNKSRKSITDLMDIRPDYANLISGEKIQKVNPKDVLVGDTILIKIGEKIPLDGRVIEGDSLLDTSALTGESMPQGVHVGSTVLSGSINKYGVLKVMVDKEYGESTVSKILEMVENASSKKSKTENFITKFAFYYTPIVVIVALLLAIIPPIFIRGELFSDWIYRALVFLVISCPCALVISIPLGFFGGIGAASKEGILIKGSNYLEALKNVDIVIFDKTGTLTKGSFKVTEIKPENGYTKEEVLEYAALAESYSNHPIAISIVKEYGKDITKENIKGIKEIPGLGVKAIVNGREILSGNDKFMKDNEIYFNEVEKVGTIVYLAIDRKFAGFIIIEDEIKEGSKEVIEKLKDLGVKKTVMLTGDSIKVAEKVAFNIGIDEYYGKLLPGEKVSILEKILNENKEKGKVLFVGDGINDAPVLSRADIGIAMGGLGSDAAIEASDIVIMNDDLYKIPLAIKIGKRTRIIVVENIVFALGVKLIVLSLGAFGEATILEAVFADVGVALIAVLNSTRALKVKK